MGGAVGSLEPGNVCESQVGCQKALGESGKSRGEEFICSSLIVQEIISLHVTLGGESRREVSVLWHGGAVGIPCLRASPAPHPESRQERSCLREDTQKEGVGGVGVGGHFWGRQGAAGGQGTH